jgi:hypothetical protein
MIRIFRKVADVLGGYERLTCPHCDLQIRFRGVDDAEAKRLRASMAEHTEKHAATSPGPETP